MRLRPTIVFHVIALSLFGFIATTQAGTNLVANTSQGSGASWLSSIWKTNSGAGTGVGTAVAPVAGNTYTYMPNSTPFGNNLGNARTRNPVTNSTAVATFPGDSLTMTTNTEIRTKNITWLNATTPATPAIVPTLNFPGVSGNPGLILNGGVLNAGDDGVPTITGSIRVATTSFICPGDNGAGTTARPNRAFTVAGQLSGNGSMVILQTPTNLAQTISGVGNTYNGQWFIKAGRLLGTTPGSLGTNSITVDPMMVPPPPMNATVAATNSWFNGPAVLEAGYTLNGAGVLILTNGGLMRLHQEVCFPAVIIEGTSLSPGIHYFLELSTNFPNNFDPGGSGALVVQPYGTPPPLPPSILAQPLNQQAIAGKTTRFSVTASDNGFPPLTYQWRRSGTNLTDVGNISGSTNSILVLANVSAADAGAPYDVIVANASFTVTSTVATVTLVTPNGSPYETAVLAANPVAFYDLNETTDPTSGTAQAFDLVGGYVGLYGTAVQNGNPVNANIGGPQAATGYPGFVTGNTAAQFANGSPNSRLPVLPWNLNTNTVTITAWIAPYAPVLPNEGFVVCRGPNTVAGLVCSSGGYLGYIWNNEQPTYGWNSGLVPAQGQWSFVALVVTPTNATVYMMNTNGLSASAHAYNHIVQPFDGTTLLGDDSLDGNSGSRTFGGIIDAVAVFNTALSADQLLGLYSAASGIANFPPFVAVPPSSTNLYQGQTATFTGLAIGTGPLVYQWQSGTTGSGVYANINDGGQFSGSATPTLTVSNIGNANALDYVVVVTNSYGATTSTPPATLTVLPTSAAQNITLSVQQATGFDWDNATAPNNWSDGLSASESAAAYPGSTFDVLPGARLRSPANPVVATFPGNVLSLDGDGVWNVNPPTNGSVGELRFKQPTYGTVNGTVIFPKLRMNGGQLDAGNDGGPVIVDGEIDILTNAPINNDSSNDRGYVINAWLTGSGNIEYHGYAAFTFQTGFSNNLNIAGTSSTYSGTWNAVSGTLLGTGPNALGTNSIIIGTPAALETTYDINSTNATLILNGRMFLHQNDRFRGALVNGISLPPGTNTFASLNALYPTNFPATWKPQVGAANFSAGSGSIIILSNTPPFITSQPKSLTLWGQQTAQFSVAAIGNPTLVYQWRAGVTGSGTFTNLSDGANLFGSTSNVLSITNVTLANGLDYILVVSNLYGATLSQVATLTVRPGPTITTEPVAAYTAYVGETVSMNVATLGLLPLTDQWQSGATGSGVFANLSDNGHFSGSGTTNLTISNVSLADAADYRFIVSNAGGSVTSIVETLTVLPTNPAVNLTLDFGATPIVQPTGSDWDTVNNWSDGQPASISARSNPGSTYEVVTGARLRSPVNANLPFPGVKLTVDGSGVFTNNNDITIGEIRFKHANAGTITFTQLVMNGGQLDNGDNGLLILAGEIDILTNTPFYADTAAAVDRGWQINAWLTGTNSIEYHDWDGSFGNPGGLNIAGTSNTFSGTWLVVQGVLIGSAANSLGTNSITVGTNSSSAALETTYDINNPGATLSVDTNGQVFLHQNDTFQTLMVSTTNGTFIPLAGRYSFAQLAALFPANFPASWTQQQGSSARNASGSITVLVGSGVPAGPVINTDPASRAGVPGSTATFTVAASTFTGITNYQWQLNNVPLAAGTNATLVLANLQSTNFGSYKVVVSDGFGRSVTSASAQLTVATAPTFTSSVSGSTLSLSFTTQVGPTYVVEYKQSITDPTWTTLATRAGTGGVIVITDNMTAPERFYRIRAF